MPINVNVCIDTGAVLRVCDRFAALSASVVEWNVRERCGLTSSPASVSTSRSPLTLTYHWYLAALMIAMAMITYKLLGGGVAKPKLN